MAAITTRATAAAGATVKGGALTAAEMDANFLNINDEMFVDGLPTVKPSLVLDFIGGTQVDPRVTFTRASSATFYDASSTAKAEENLLTNSSTRSLTPILGAVFNGNQNFTLSAATQIIYAPIAGGPNLGIGFEFSISCDLSGSGVVRLTGLSGGGGPIGNDTVVTLTGTPTRYSWSGVNTQPGVNVSLALRGAADNSTATVTVTNVQLENRLFSTAYTPTTTTPITRYQPRLMTAPANTPRLDFDPVTREPRGLLIEEQRTNLLLRSETFDVSWTLSGATRTQNAAVAPDGQITATAIAGVDQGVYQVQAGVDSQNYTATIYAKAGTSSSMRFGLTNQNESAARYYIFDLTNGTFTLQSAGFTNASASMQSVGNGWYRCVVTGTSPSSGTTGIGQFIRAINGSIFIWGAQLEAGAFATSYIPTVASQVTRVADVASINALSPWFNANEGTLLFEGEMFAEQAGINSHNLASITDGGPSNFIRLYTYSGVAGMTVRAGGVNQADTGPAGSVALNTPFKLAGAYRVDDFAVSRNGSAAATDNSGLLPSGLTSLLIGSNNNQGSFANGRIRRLAYYPKRLTNTQLQYLTK